MIRPATRAEAGGTGHLVRPEPFSVGAWSGQLLGKPRP